MGLAWPHQGYGSRSTIRNSISLRWINNCDHLVKSHKLALSGDGHGEVNQLLSPRGDDVLSAPEMYPLSIQTSLMRLKTAFQEGSCLEGNPQQDMQPEGNMVQNDVPMQQVMKI